ncbi:MAG: hypothetical protein ACSHX3_09145 [Litorimonas sp.]
MFDTAILHVGMPKTGSSSLQRFLEANRKSLTQKGFVYVDNYGDLPKSALGVYIAGSRDTANYQAIRQKLSQTDLAKKIKNHLTYLTKSASDGDTLLISSEYLWEAGTEIEQRELLTEILKPFVRDIRIIAYLRRQDRLVNSSITTRLKIGLPTPFDNIGAFFSPGASRYDYGGSLDGWAETFGADNVEARILEPGKLVGDDVIEDYASCVGIDLAGLNLEKLRANPSLSPMASAFLGEVERWIPFFKDGRRNRERMRLNWALDERFAAPIRWVNQDTARSFVEHYKTSNAEVANYVSDLDGKDVFDKDFSDYPENAPEFGNYSFSDAVEISAALWQHNENEILTLRAAQKSLSDQLSKERENRKFFSEKLNKEREDRKFFSEQLDKERKDKKFFLEQLDKERTDRKFFSEKLNKEREDRKFFSEQLNIERADKHFLSGKLNKERGNYPAAITHFEKAISLHDNAPSSYASLLDSTRNLQEKSKTVVAKNEPIKPLTDQEHSK